MKKSKYYYNVKFPVRVVEEAYNFFVSKLDNTKEIKPPRILEITIGEETWCFDTKEEFFADYPRADEYHFNHYVEGNQFTIIGPSKNYIFIKVELPTWEKLEAVFQIFERNIDSSIIKTNEPLNIFIGHGSDSQWRDLKDHLHEKHGINITT